MQDYRCRQKSLFYGCLLHMEKCWGCVDGQSCKRNLFLICLCCSMSLEAISPSQRGSAEGVTLFCALIGLLSRIVEEDNFGNFILIVISSSLRWKFILHTCKRLFFFQKWNRTSSDVHTLSHTNARVHTLWSVKGTEVYPPAGRAAIVSENSPLVSTHEFIISLLSQFHPDVSLLPFSLVWSGNAFP